MESLHDNPYLSGNFAPVCTEIEVAKLTVEGELPPELQGTFVRNGPNPHFAPLGRYHWFDGDGMLHGVTLENGQASYRNRYVRTAGWQEEDAAGKALYGGLLDGPAKHGGQLPFKNTANTSVLWHAGRCLTLWEGGPPHEVNIPSLATVGAYDFGGKLSHAFTAHPKVDPQTGELFFFGYNPVSPPHLVYSVADKTGAIVATMPVPSARPTMMHDFAITEHYAVFLDFPQLFSLARARAGEAPWRFEGNQPTRIGLLPRDGHTADIRWFEAAPSFAFHTLQAFEEANAVVLRACRSARFPDELSLGGKNGTGRDVPVLYEWRLSLKDGTVSEQALDDAPSEFPRQDERFLGAITRYGFAARSAGPYVDGIVRYDFQRSGTTEVCAFDGNHRGGEAVFVPRSPSAAEGDGWLLTFLFDATTEKSELAIVDAQAMQVQARVHLPVRVPYGFHGQWISR